MEVCERFVCERRCLLMYRYVHALRYLPQGCIVPANVCNTRRSSRTNHSLAILLPCHHIIQVQLETENHFCM